MKNITLKFENLIPMPVQSIRGGRYGFYQPKKVTDYKELIRNMAYTQLPDDWTPFTTAVKVIYLQYSFPIPQSMPKMLKEAILLDKNIVYRAKRPDLEDNLFKGLADALSGLIWEDDSIIVESNLIRKVYAEIPGIVMELQEFTGLYY